MTPFKSDTPCWHAYCDTCGEHEARHFDTLAELIDVLQGEGWWIPLGAKGEPLEVHCRGCADDMLGRMRELRYVWLN